MGKVGLGLLVFWAASVLAASSYADTTAEAGMVVLVMLLYVAYCMATVIDPWPWWRRVLFVVGAWVAHALLQVPVGLAVGALLNEVRPHLVNRATAIGAAMPIVLLAMRYSTAFMRRRGLTAEPIIHEAVYTEAIERDSSEPIVMLDGSDDHKWLWVQIGVPLLLAFWYFLLSNR